MYQIEKEVKILNVDVQKVKEKLELNGIKLKGKYIQDIYTFDIPTVDILYKRYVDDMISKNDSRGFRKLILEVRPCFDKEDLEKTAKVLGTKDFIEFIDNGSNDLNRLKSDELINVMKKAENNFSKWIRLRKTGDETTLTIKCIVNSKGEYELDAVKELEFNVPSLDKGKQFLADLGYFPARHQIKMRLVYNYKNAEIVIDKWPKLNPYIEIEAPTKEDIEEAILMLGYQIDDAIVINTDDVYSKIGIDIYSKEYSNLSFSDEETTQVKEYMS